MKKNILIVLITFVITMFGVVFYLGDAITYKYIYNDIASMYDGTVDESEMMESILTGIVDGLGDEHSIYFDSKESEMFWQSLNTEYEGIGIMISTNEQTGIATVTEVFDEGVASKENIYPGDQIKKVNGETITKENVLDVADMIKSEKEVNLELYRPSTKETIKITTVGKSYTQPSVTHKIYKENNETIGYIDIDSFSKTTGVEFEKALIAIEDENIDKLIIDVRDNGGGELDQLVYIANLIIPNTKPYLIIKRGSDIQEEYVSELKEPKDYEIIGLQNENTASCSEILMAALKEVNNSEIVGTTSYGKGSVQQTMPLDSTGGTLKITVEHWFTANGNTIEGTGIEPTIEIDEKMPDLSYIILEEELKKGDESLQSVQVINYLEMLGYEIKSKSTYTTEVETTIKEFQAENDLEVSGIVDVKTAEKLTKEALKASTNVENDPYIKKAISL